MTGILVPPRDATAVAAAIERLLARPDERQRMGKAGRELVVREFSLARVIDETLVLYDAILGGEISRRLPDV